MQWIWDQANSAKLRNRLTAQGIEAENTLLSAIDRGHPDITTLAQLPGRRLIIRHQLTIRPDAPDVLCETRYLAKLNEAGVLTPRVLGMTGVGEALDVPLYVMEHIDGIVIADDLPPQFAPAPQAMAEAIINAPADLHRNDASRSLADLDVNRRQFDMIRALLESLSTSEGDALRVMADRLAQGIPDAGPPAIMHSDCRPGYLMWQRGMPPLLAALPDWGRATIGDPRLDPGSFMISHPGDPIPHIPLQDLGRALYQADFLPVGQRFARHWDRTGSPSADPEWFSAFVSWKTAVSHDPSRARGGGSYYNDHAHCQAFLAAAQVCLDLRQTSGFGS